MPQREPALLWLRDFALTALVIALCTLTSWVFFRLDFVSSNYILTYILGVMYINVFTSGLVYGVVASLFSVMLVNYMFIDPFMQFRIRSDDMVTAVVMLCVSLLCSSLTGRIKGTGRPKRAQSLCFAGAAGSQPQPVGGRGP